MKASCAFAVQKLRLPGLQAKGPGTDFLQDGCALSVNIWENPGHCSQVLWVDAKVEEQQGQATQGCPCWSSNQLGPTGLCWDEGNRTGDAHPALQVEHAPRQGSSAEVATI